MVLNTFPGLTEAQEQELHSIGAAENLETEIQALKYVDPDLYYDCKHCNSDIQWLWTNARRLVDVAVDYDYVTMPIGSPAFVAIFLYLLYAYDGRPTLLYSHSDVRRLTEATAEKRGMAVYSRNHRSFIRI
jgi:hypothetical protein